MSVEALLTELATAGIRLIIQGDKLRYYAPVGTLTEKRKQAIVQHRAELLHRLRELDEEQVSWRMQAIREQIATWPGSGLPFLVARREGPIRDGWCLSCGDSLPGGRRARCVPCLIAITRVLADGRSPRKEAR